MSRPIISEVPKLPSTSHHWVEVSTNSTIRSDGGRYGKSITEAVITDVPGPDVGCHHPKHVQLPIEM